MGRPFLLRVFLEGVLHSHSNLVAGRITNSWRCLSLMFQSEYGDGAYRDLDAGVLNHVPAGIGYHSPRIVLAELNDTS